MLTLGLSARSERPKLHGSFPMPSGVGKLL